MIKLTKNALRDQEHKLQQLQRYLPTLQLKKAMLQVEVNQTAYEIEKLTQAYAAHRKICDKFQALFLDRGSITLFEKTRVQRVEKRYENIAGASIPYFEEVIFVPPDYSLLDTPVWIDSGLEQLKGLITSKAKIKIAEEKRAILEEELHIVSIRVNLFEKVLIPRSQDAIKQIKIVLGDQERASVAQAKVAKKKILKKKEVRI